MARAMGLPGWHSMRKDELVRALVNHAKRKPKKFANGQGVDSLTAVMSRDAVLAAGRSAKSSKAHERLRRTADRDRGESGS